MENKNVTHKYSTEYTLFPVCMILYCIVLHKI